METTFMKLLERTPVGEPLQKSEPGLGLRDWYRGLKVEG